MLVTICPQCNTTFRVSGEILRKARGRVRCGRCAHVFDAGISLHERPDRETRSIHADEPVMPQHPRPPGDAAGTAAVLPAVLAEPASQTADDADSVSNTPGAARARAPDDPEAQAEAAANAEADTEADASPEADAEAEASPEANAETNAEAEAEPHPESEPETEPEPAAATAIVSAADAGPVAVAEAAADAELPSAAARPANALREPPQQTMDDTDWLPPLRDPHPRRRWPDLTAAGLLLVVLAVQIVHEYRGVLVTVPGIGTAVAGVYASLGLEANARVDLGQYDLLDLTAVAEPITEDRGWLVIETRVRNNGPHVQPVPYIFVSLLDRWQEVVAGRYFSPDEYAVTPLTDTSAMTSGSTIDAQFIIADPGPGATGFELRICTPMEQGYQCDGESPFK